MTDAQDDVRIFNLVVCKKNMPESPTIPDIDIMQLRWDLIDEELDELANAMSDRNLVEIADALADLQYVVLGAACTFGIDLEPIFDMVHISNMAKEGGPINADGKKLKPPGWKPPTENIKKELIRQGAKL